MSLCCSSQQPSAIYYSMSNAIGSSRISNPSHGICNFPLLQLGHVADDDNLLKIMIFHSVLTVSILFCFNAIGNQSVCFSNENKKKIGPIIMSECTQYEHNGHRYEFSTECFYCGLQRCESNGGTLASYLDENTYFELRKCCENGLNYWIVCLKIVYALTVLSVDTHGLMILHAQVFSTLNIIPLPNSAQNGQAVTILFNANLPQPLNAREIFDNEKQRYICQYLSTISTTTVSTVGYIKYSHY